LFKSSMLLTAMFMVLLCAHYRTGQSFRTKAKITEIGYFRSPRKISHRNINYRTFNDLIGLGGHRPA
jgi:hypothetical protein